MGKTKPFDKTYAWDLSPLAASLCERSDAGSRMSRETNVRFWERAAVQLRRATRLVIFNGRHLRRVLSSYRVPASSLTNGSPPDSHQFLLTNGVRCLVRVVSGSLHRRFFDLDKGPTVLKVRWHPRFTSSHQFDSNSRSCSNFNSDGIFNRDRRRSPSCESQRSLRQL